MTERAIDIETSFSFRKIISPIREESAHAPRTANNRGVSTGVLVK
ncbi:hypothetical protein [Palaeococcus sp. (in: euryarchaeotes)]